MYYKKGCIFGLVGLLMVGSVGWGLASQPVPREQTLIIATGLQPSTLDIGVCYEAASINVFLAVYERLVRYSPGSTSVEPELAEAWQVSPDGKVWTFYLRQGVKFHDGTDFNAAAVKFSFDRVLALNLGPAWMFSPIEQITVINDRTVQFSLKHPYPEFLQVLANIFGTGIVSPTAVQAHDVGEFAQAWLSENMVGTGPYRFVEWIKGQHIILERFDEYWRGWERREKAPKRIIIRYVLEPAVQRLLLEGGDVDIAMNISPDDWEVLKFNPRITLVEEPSLHATYLRFNMAAGPTADRRVREAIRAALDYEAMIKNVLLGHATQMQGSAGKGLACHNDKLPMLKQDLELARRLLAEAGYPHGGFTLEYVFESGHDDRRMVGELLQSSLRKLGIELKIIELPWPSLWERLCVASPEEHPAIVANGWWPDYADVINYLYPMYHSSQWPPIAFNIGFYKNPVVDQLLDEAQVEVNPERRCQLLLTVQELIYDDVADIPLYHLTTRIAMRDWVKGYVYSPIYTEGFYFYDMWIDR